MTVLDVQVKRDLVNYNKIILELDKIFNLSMKYILANRNLKSGTKLLQHV